MDELSAQIRNCMYQYSRAIYRSIKDLIDPYADPDAQLEYRRQVLEPCEEMAERRALTARDVKGNVEGYSEMSDEAFARRFYSDRAELRDLGVPLQSQRDEFTGEELYTLRSDRYFLPALELTDDELAALQTCFYLLEGKFAYAEPLRLALQNLALGRPGLAEEAPSGTALRVEMRDPDYSAELPGRLAKLA